MSTDVTARAESVPPGLWGRIREPRTLASFVFALVLVVFLVRRLDIDLAAVWRQVRSANLPLLGAAVLIFYTGFVVRALRLRWMLTQAGIAELPEVKLPSNRGLTQIVVLAWFANSVVPARLGDVYRGYLLKQRANAPFTTSIGVIAAERLIDLVVLVVVFVASGLVIFGAHVPSETRTVTMYGSATVLVGLLVVWTAWICRHRLLRLMPNQIAAPLDRVQHGLFANLRNPWRAGAYALAIWSIDGARFFVVAWALNVVLNPVVALFVVVIAAFAAVSPVTPAGLGVVEAVLIAVLPLVGVEGDTATAVVILERLVSYWSLIVVGLLLYVFTLRREVAGGRPRHIAPT